MANSINSTYCNANIGMCVCVFLIFVVVCTGIEGKKKTIIVLSGHSIWNLEQNENKLLLQVSAFIMVSTRAPMQL